MTRLCVTSKTQTYRIIKRVCASVGFLNYVVNVNTSTTKLMADTTPSMRFDKGKISNLSWEWHVICS